MLNEILRLGLEHPRSYLIRGDKEKIIPEVFRAVREVWDFVPQGSPNVLSIDGHMSVEEARELIDFASMSPLGEDKIKIILLSAERVTREAQNTLLKLTEEPNASLRIFVIVPNDVELLPTLLSRLEDISHAFEKSVGEASTGAKNFLSLGLKERFKLAESIAKDEDETATDIFLRDLEKVIYKKKFTDDLQKTKAFEAISFAKNIGASQNRPKKMILETLAISLPNIE